MLNEISRTQEVRICCQPRYTLKQGTPNSKELTFEQVRTKRLEEKSSLFHEERDECLNQYNVF